MTRRTLFQYLIRKGVTEDQALNISGSIFAELGSLSPKASFPAVDILTAMCLQFRSCAGQTPHLN